MFPKLFRKEIVDQWIQENFRLMQQFFVDDAVSRCLFEFLEFEVPGVIANFKYPHSLGYQPKDVILMHNSENAGIVFNYNKFNASSIDLTSTGPGATTLRLLLGRYV